MPSMIEDLEREVSQAEAEVSFAQKRLQYLREQYEAELAKIAAKRDAASGRAALAKQSP